MLGVTEFCPGLGEGKLRIREKIRQTAIAAAAVLIQRLLALVNSCDKYRNARHNPDSNRVRINSITFNQIMPFPAAIRKNINSMRLTINAIVIYCSIFLYLGSV